MFKLMDKKIITILHKLFLLNWPYGLLVLSLFVEVLCFVLVFVVQYLVSFLVLQSSGFQEERVACLTVIVLLMPCVC